LKKEIKKEVKMKITNNYNLPENIVKAVEYSAHHKADYSATELIDPPRIIHLQNRFNKQIEVDASDRIWVLLGSAIHYILEKSATINQLEESYITTEICDRTLSGTSDLYEDRKISDYKITSAWTLVYGSRIKKWEEQLNIYAYMFRALGFPVDKIEIITILRDWSQTQALRNKNYPQKPVQVLKIPLWTQEKQEQFITERIKTLIGFETTPNNDLPFCTAEDRWQKDNAWAVMKEGRKSAVRVFDNEKDAKELNKTEPKFYIEFRKGESVRCEKYCLVKEWCDQYQNEIKQKDK